MPFRLLIVKGCCDEASILTGSSRSTRSDESFSFPLLSIILVFAAITPIATIINISNVIVARSGAMTITEISNLGKPSILVPLPNVSQNHQLYNAKVLADVGAAKIILNDELKKENLNEEIEKIIKTPEIMHEMEEKAFSKSVKNVQEKIYKEIKKLV